VRRIATALSETIKLKPTVRKSDIEGLEDGLEVSSLFVTSGLIRMDADGLDVIKVNGSTFQLTTGTTVAGNFRGVAIGNAAAAGAVNAVAFSNSSAIGTDAGKAATTFQTSNVIGDTSAGAATTIQNSDVIGNEGGNSQSSITSCVIIGNVAGQGQSSSTATTSVVIGQQAARWRGLTSSVIIGRSAGEGPNSAGNTFTSSILIGFQTGNDLTGARTGLVLIGNDVQAPTATTDNYLNIANVILSDLTGTIVEFPGTGIRISTQATPASATAAGTKGDIVHDTDYIYVCTATNTWKRAALSTW
jgi:hypothetical protein